MKCPYCKGTGELNPKTIGEVVKHLRRSKEWNQAKLAKKAGLGTSMICTLEKNRNPTISTLKKVAKGLNCKVADLLPF